MPAARLRATLPVLALLLLPLAGCGSDAPSAPSAEKPSAEVTRCRAQWTDLGDDVAGNADRTEPSGLAERWTSVVATVDYYRTAATAKDCGTRLEDQRKAIAALEAFGVSLKQWDLEARLATVKQGATAYAGSRPTPTPRRKGVPQKPKPAAVAAALAVATRQAPLATEQQAPAWRQANVVELGDRAAVAKARKDLAFLSTQSAAYRQGAAALAVIAKAVTAVR